MAWERLLSGRHWASARGHEILHPNIQFMQCCPTLPTDPLKPIAASRTKSLPCSLHRVKYVFICGRLLIWHGTGYTSVVTMWPQYQHELQSLYAALFHTIMILHWLHTSLCNPVSITLECSTVGPSLWAAPQESTDIRAVGAGILPHEVCRLFRETSRFLKNGWKWVISTVLFFSCIYRFLRLCNSISVSCLPIYLFVHSIPYLLVCLSIYLIIYCISMRFLCIRQFICLNIHLLHRFVDREREREGGTRSLMSRCVANLRVPTLPKNLWSLRSRNHSASSNGRSDHLVEDLPCKMLHTKEATGPERKMKSWNLTLRDKILQLRMVK